ncbi:MAG TPA: alpha-amylase family glycosyl hydrolase [Tepidisphaeraceae bacterium]|nr:alpha-amylase family glycosyl hydrolase [Tepidisphaeraceae bacterium]
MNAEQRRSNQLNLIRLFCWLLLLLGAAGSSRASDDDIYTHRFEYDPPAGARPQSVVVAGDFNGWSQTATPMHRDGGEWVADVDLSEGAHLYKFVVDGQWTNDSLHSDPELEQPDGHNGKNSAVLIGPDARRLPPMQPGVIEAQELVHKIGDQRYCNVVTQQRIRLALRARAGNIDHAFIRWSDGGAQWKRQEMYDVDQHLGFDDWAGLVDSANGPVRYFFELTDGPTAAYYADGHLYQSIDDAAVHAYSNDMQWLFTTPDWAQHAVWYQIFPERFRNGDPSNDPPNTVPWTSSWYSKLPGESGEFYHDVWRRRYGGDIQGIDEELPYLRSLGITCIYLNPIFKAEDLHKYDTSDYRHVDDHFGYAGDISEIKGETDDPSTWQWTRTDRLFLSFLADAHRQGFHVIIDGVFNHVGKANYAFQDVLKNGQKSRYASWFSITSWNPIHWMGWGGSPDGMLPEFRKDPQLGLVHGPRELVMAITRRWLAPDGDPSRGVDGFRLDVCQNIPQPFWVDWRKLVKSIKPDAYTSGEIWTICPDWLNGQTFDATMQYPFAQASESFFVDQRNAISPTKFGQLLSQFLIVYPFQISLDQMNLLDSHDTDRWSSRFVNPDLAFNASSRIEDNNPNYNTAKPDDADWTRIKQSLVVQMTYVGAPMIYYGDEAGMWGPSDPSDRQPMIWKDLAPYDDPQVTFKQDLFDHYQRLIAIRQALPALQTGFAHAVLADDAAGVYAFSRDLGDQHVCVIVNRSGVERTEHLAYGPADEDGYFMDWLDPMEASMNAGPPGGRPSIQAGGDVIPAAISRHGQMVVTLKPWGAMILSERN